MRTIVVAAALLATSCDLTAASDPPHVRGLVTNAETGAPMKGAEVTVFFQPAASDDRPWPFRRFERMNLRTGTEGRFEAAIPEAAAAGDTVFAFVRAAGYAEWRDFSTSAGTSSPLTVVKPGQDVELNAALKRGRTLEGQITDSDGHPVAGARLTLTLSGPGWCSWPQTIGMGKSIWPDEVRSGSDGRWEMLSFPYEQAAALGGRWVLTIEHDHMAPGIVQSLESFPAKDGEVTVRTTLHRGRALSGRVIDGGGKPVGGAVVWLEGPAKSDEPMCVRLRAEGQSAADGSFMLGGLDDRSYELHAKAKGFASPEAKNLRVGDPQRKPLVVTLATGETLRGRLLDDAGRPLDGVEVRLRSEAPRSQDSAETTSDGSFEFDGLSRGTVTISSFTLFERSVTVPSEPLEIRVPKRREVVVALRTAEDAKSVSPPAKVYFRGPSFSSYRELTAADGRVSLGPHVPGEYTVVGDAPGRAVLSKTIQVATGEGVFDVALELRRGFVLRGRVTDGDGHAVGGAKVRAQADLYDIRETTTGADGRYVLEGLNDERALVGSLYVISASAERRAAGVVLDAFSRVSLLERTQDFVLGEGGTIRGTVRRKDGKLAPGVLVKTVVVGHFYAALHVPSPWVVTDEKGRYELRHVTVGTVRLTVGDTEQKVKVAEGKTLDRDFTVER